MEKYDHVIFCSAGNGMWKSCWKDVVKNIKSFDPGKVTVVLLGSAELWTRVAEETPPNMSFFEDVKWLLREKQVQIGELTSSLESLEYVDNEGHPSKSARWDLAAQLVEVFEELIEQNSN